MTPEEHNTPKKNRPAWSWICQTCSDGMTQRTTTSTYHHGVCYWCEEEGAVTSSRDFGYPKLPEREAT